MDHFAKTPFVFTKSNAMYVAVLSRKTKTNIHACEVTSYGIEECSFR